VPQMAETDTLFRRVGVTPGTTLSALVPNVRGMERALDCGLREIAVFTAASDAFARHNIGMGIDASLRVFRDVVCLAAAHGCRVRAYISTAWWCPYSGRIDPENVRPVAQALLEMGCYEISLGDTIGAATPGDVAGLIGRLGSDMSVDVLAVHFHDTRGTALANVLSSLLCGVSTVDASAGGLGGCPYAPGATGNLATEDLLYMLHGLGIDTGIDLAAVAETSTWLAGILGRALPSRVLAAGFIPLLQ